LKRRQSEVEIVARKVTNLVERSRCLAAIAGRDCVVLEHTIYDLLCTLTDDHDGGFWDYFQLSNGGFYMAPKSAKSFHIFCSRNGFERDTCANTAGIIATAMAYSHLTGRPRGSYFARAYERLSDFIFQQSDADTIRAALY
jgi:hypothetical protein